MKRKCFSVEQVTAILKQAELGTPIADLLRQHGVSEQSYLRWKRLYGGMELSEARELRMLRKEKVKLKKLVADPSLDKVMSQDVSQKVLKPVKKRAIVNCLMGRYGVGNRKACRCVQLRRSVYFYHSRMDPLVGLRQRVRELAPARVRFGYRRIYMLLKREGWDVGKGPLLSRVLRGKPGVATQSVPGGTSQQCIENKSVQPVDRTKFWGMDFVADQLSDGRKIRTLTIIDLFTRERLAIEVGFSLRAQHV